MITRAQQVLVKRAQREAAIDDAEYRDALEVTAGCRSTTDPAMTDRGVDLVLAFMEAILFRKVDRGQLQAPCKANAVFRQRGYWARKNARQETSRDRFNRKNLAQGIADLEFRLLQLGFGSSFCRAIRAKVTGGRNDDRSLFVYQAALRRTLQAKQNKVAASADAATTDVGDIAARKHQQEF